MAKGGSSKPSGGSRKRSHPSSTYIRGAADLAADQEPARKRQFTGADQKLAGIFESLADVSNEVRIQAAKELLGELEGKSADDEGIDKIVRRLVRGLCSGRKAARYGFFVSFAEVVRLLYGPGKGGDEQIKGLLRLIQSTTKTGVDAVGQERRDHNFGRLYSCKALIESEILTRELSPLELWNDTLEQIFSLAVSTPWIREECGMVLCDAVKTAAQMKRSSELVKSILVGLESHKLHKTPEGISVWLTVQSSLPKFKKWPKDIWKEEDPLASDNRSELRQAMREQYNASSEKETNGTKVKAGHWQQTVHYAWDVVLQRALALTDLSSKSEETEEKSETNKFKSIWRGLVDDGLFQEKSSLERKFWGFQIFAKMLRAAPDWAVPFLFTKNLLFYLINNQKDENKMLHGAAADSLKKMKARVREEPKLAATMVSGLTSHTGSVFFDRLTRTKTIEELISLADGPSMSAIVTLLDTTINNQKGKEQKEADNARSAVADMLRAGLKTKSKDVLNDSESKPWIKSLIALFVKYAYCSPRIAETKTHSLPTPPVSPESRTIFHTKFLACITHILSEKPDNPTRWPWYALHHLHSVTKSSKDLQLALDADKSITKTIKNAYNTAKDLEKQDVNNPIVLLFSLALLQAYSGDADAISVLNELNEHLGSNVEANVVIEILLSFLSKPATLFKNMANQVFESMTQDITTDGLESLLAIISQPETLAGQQELFAENADEDDAEDVADDSEDIEMDSDVEVVEARDGAKGDSADDGEDDDEDDEDDDDEVEAASDDEPDGELTAFESKLALALQTSRISGTLPNGDAGTAASDSSDDELMDDDQMLELEPTLANIFREQRSLANKNKEKKHARENVANFKRRVLELLAIYVRHEHANGLALAVVLPLLELRRTTRDSSIRDKATDVLKTYAAACSKSKQYPALSAEGIEGAWELLEDIHKEAQSDNSHAHTSACSKASLFVVRTLVTLDAANYDRAVDVYAETQKQWFKSVKTKGTQPSFFTEWVSWSIEMRKNR